MKYMNQYLTNLAQRKSPPIGLTPVPGWTEVKVCSISYWIPKLESIKLELAKLTPGKKTHYYNFRFTQEIAGTWEEMFQQRGEFQYHQFIERAAVSYCQRVLKRHPPSGRVRRLWLEESKTFTGWKEILIDAEKQVSIYVVMNA